MDLHTYFKKPGRRQMLAAAIDSDAQYLWQLANQWKGKKPSADMAIRIHEATKGKVSLSSLRPDYWPVAKKRSDS